MDIKSKFLSVIRTFFEKITEPHPSVTDERKRLEAKMVSFMVLVMILGVTLNLIFGTGLTTISLAILIVGYIFSRTHHNKLAIYLIIGILLVSMINSLLSSENFDNFTIFTNVAWLTLSHVFASLLLSIRESIWIALLHFLVLYLLTVFVPEINLKGIGVSFGYI